MEIHLMGRLQIPKIVELCRVPRLMHILRPGWRIRREILIDSNIDETRRVGRADESRQFVG
jgi:hypothetical protein